MAWPTQWTWVWVDSGSCWWTGRPGMLWFMGSQRIRHDWPTELTFSQSFNGDQSFCLPISPCLSDFKCISYLLWSWRVVRGSITVQSVPYSAGSGGGAGLDWQVIPFLRVCQELSSPGKFGSARSEDRYEAQTSFSQWLSLSYWG